MTRNNFTYAIFGALLIGMVCGCGPKRPACVAVSGKVLLDGKPLKTGFVRVMPEKERAATGQIDAQGNFRLTTFVEGDGCVPGRHPVEVIACERPAPGQIRWLVPVKYQNTATSGLYASIDGPTDEWVIELSWEGDKPFVERSDASGDIDPAKIK
jgi:hypothetical protein